MTDRQDISILRNLTRPGRRWETTSQVRQDALELVERVIQDESKPTGLRLKAVQMLCVFEAQNLVDDRIQMEVGSGNDRQATMVLLLPENGSERTSPLEATSEGTEDVVEFDDWAKASAEAERTS